MKSIAAQRWAQTLGAYQADTHYQSDIRQILCQSATGTFDLVLANGARFSLVENQGPTFETPIDNFQVVDTSGSANSIVLRVLSGARWTDKNNVINGVVATIERYLGGSSFLPVTVNYSAPTLIASASVLGGRMIILNSHIETLYLGDDAVTTATGFAVPPGYGVEWELCPSSLYGRFVSVAGRVDRLYQARET